MKKEDKEEYANVLGRTPRLFNTPISHQKEMHLMLTFPARECFTLPYKEVLPFSPVEGTYLTLPFTAQKVIPFMNMNKRDNKGCNIWLLPGLGISHGSPIYQRSNEQISKDAYQRIEQHPLFDMSRIELNVEQGKVTIDGTVDAPILKEMLEQTLYHISGVSYVDNRLRLIASENNESEIINNI